ncbi:MAG: ABC transporter permease, partial [Armatimonadetes bacterium]|nr:ABC transporter permease [Armatimonadota bacterium]
VSISVLERTRELATLRTIGYGLRSIAWFTTVENLMLAAVGVGVGVPLGRWLNYYLMTSMETETMSIEPVVYARTYVIGVVGVLALTLVSQVPSLLHLKRLNLAAATKEIGT